MFPCLQNLSVYGNFGNGGDWYHHASEIGLSTSVQPVAGWLASFSTNGWPSGTGDVGLIQSVNNDGTVTRYGVNWHMDGKWSTDRVSASIVIGSFQPPCNSSGVQTLSTSGGSQSGGCHTFSMSFPLGLGSICFDGVIGIAAVGGGMLMMIAGAIVMIAAVGGSVPTTTINIRQTGSKPTAADKSNGTSSADTGTKSAPTTYRPGPSANQPPPKPPTVNDKDLVATSRQRAQARNLQYRQRALPSGSRRTLPAATKRGLPPSGQSWDDFSRSKN